MDVQIERVFSSRENVVFVNIIKKSLQIKFHCITKLKIIWGMGIILGYLKNNDEYE